VPVLARTLEEAGLSTVLVTVMPFWAEKVGAPRTLAVEFPFAQTLGRANDSEQQKRVILQALEVLETAEGPGSIVHSPEAWPQPQTEALGEWQPAEPSPVIRELGPKIRSLLRERRRRKASTPDKERPTE
jgi:hypothetical protein